MTDWTKRADYHFTTLMSPMWREDSCSGVTGEAGDKRREEEDDLEREPIKRDLKAETLLSY